jgi:hypothetical protein
MEGDWADDLAKYGEPSMSAVARIYFSFSTLCILRGESMNYLALRGETGDSDPEPYIFYIIFSLIYI